MSNLRFLLSALVLLVSGCQVSEREPAVLSVDSNPEVVEVLQNSISSLLNNSPVTISPLAFRENSELIIEHNRSLGGNIALGRDVSRPLHFQLWVQDKNCFIENKTTGEIKFISELNCIALK